jgi:NAD(P)-dependent dehydrogenase (short-subunit alcohol dehydrogenase family)
MPEDDQVFFVTGASGGIGVATAQIDVEEEETWTSTRWSS